MEEEPKDIPPEQEQEKSEEKNKETESDIEVEVRVIKQKLDEILYIINNESEIIDRVKRELLREVENRTDEIRVRIETMSKLKETSEK